MLEISSFICLSQFSGSCILDPPFHMQQNKQIDILFCKTNLTLMDGIYPKALAYIKIVGVICVKQMLWAVKVWAKMILKQPSSFTSRLLKSTFSLPLCTYITRMDVMLDFICMGPVDLPGARRKRQNTK